MKYALLVKEKLTKSIYKKLKHTHYAKIFVLNTTPLTFPIKNKRIVNIPLESDISIKQIIKQLIQEYPEYRLIPYFRGDKYSKYAIFLENQYRKNIDWKIFKHKDKMNDFLSTIAQKKNFKASKEQLFAMSYENIVEMIGCETFIIKPTNASSSEGAFKISNQKRREEVIQETSSSQQYVIEEYISGKLYSLDFIFDGENILTLALLTNDPFIQYVENGKLSDSFQQKYGANIISNYLYFLPVRYNRNTSKLSEKELSFLEGIKDKLTDIGFKGMIHLEYKYDHKNNTVGFIEWGARLGRKRSLRVKRMHHHVIENLLHDVFVNKDISKRKKHKSIYVFKDQAMDINIVGLKTNVIQKTNVFSLLREHVADFLNTSYEQYLQHLFLKYFGIEITKVTFSLKTSKHGNLYPFYMSNKTRFDYILEMDDRNFKKFRKKKMEIVESLVFHDNTPLRGSTS